MKRAAFLAQARTWIGTPYHHQARVKGVGADCIGLLVGAATELGMDVGNVPTNYTRDPDPAMLFAALRETGHVIQIDTPESGDIVLFRVRRQPTHFGLLTEYGFLHADQSFGVVEVPMDDRWRERVVAYYRVLWGEA